MYKFIIIFVQILTYVLLFLPVRIFYGTKKNLPGNLNQLKKGSLLVANHQSILDPFLILTNMPFLTIIRLFPIRFPVCHKFMANPFLWPFLKLIGCYNVGRTARKNMLALFKTRQLLKQKQTVFLFPEGKVCKKENIDEFKKGIEFLISESQNVVFAKIRGTDNLRFSQVYNLTNEQISANILKNLLKQL